MPTMHNLATLTTIDQGTPLLFISFFMVFIVIISVLFKDYVIRNGFKITPVNLKVDENLPPFFTTCVPNQKHWLHDEAVYF